MRLKVLHVINSMQPGGAEVLLANSLAEGALPEHADCHLAYFRGPSYLLDRIDKKVQVHSLSYKGILGLPGMLLRLRRLITDNNIDIVHTHLNPADVYTHLVCPATVAHVHTMHSTYSMDNETASSKLKMERMLFLSRKDANIINLSEFTREDFLRSFPFKGTGFVLNNFVHDDFFKIPAKDKEHSNTLKVIAIGTLKPLKNFEYLLEIFSKLKEFDISLDIYGGGDTSSYNKVISEQGLKVKMMGHATDLKKALGKYDIFIMPSKFEGYPLSVFEAMAASLPVMVSDIAPLRSILHENALYFPLDNATEVAEVLKELNENRSVLQDLSVQSRKYAENTARKEVYISRLLKIYESILKKQPGSAH